MKTKRVFILGAGFSKQAGMPLATEITPLLLQKFKEVDHQEMLHWFEWLEERIKWLEKENTLRETKINIEQVFDLAKFDVEAGRLEQHKCRLGRMAGNTPWQRAEHIDTWLRYMEEDLVEVIHEFQTMAKVKSGPIIKFSKFLNCDDVILTFNYDTLIEKALSQTGTGWHHGFEKEQNSGALVCKMHGSIDWLTMARNTSSSFSTIDLLFRKDDKNRHDIQDGKPAGELEFDYELARIQNDKLEAFISSRHLQYQNSQYSFSLAGLGSYKPLHRIPGMGEVWFNAINALRKAEQIYIIGFSLSPFDNMSRLYFAGVMCERARKGNLPKEVVLIDPIASDLKLRFQSVFGPDVPIRAVEKYAEDVDWTGIEEATV